MSKNIFSKIFRKIFLKSSKLKKKETNFLFSHFFNFFKNFSIFPVSLLWDSKRCYHCSQLRTWSNGIPYHSLSLITLIPFSSQPATRPCSIPSTTPWWYPESCSLSFLSSKSLLWSFQCQFSSNPVQRSIWEDLILDSWLEVFKWTGSNLGYCICVVLRVVNHWINNLLLSLITFWTSLVINLMNHAYLWLEWYHFVILLFFI